MSWIAAIVVLAFLLTMAGMIAGAFLMRSYILQIVVAILLIPVILFCGFGFLATFEPLPRAQQWAFRIGYTVIGLGLTAAVLALLVKRPARPGGNRPVDPD